MSETGTEEPKGELTYSNLGISATYHPKNEEEAEELEAVVRTLKLREKHRTVTISDMESVMQMTSVAERVTDAFQAEARKIQIKSAARLVATGGIAYLLGQCELEPYSKGVAYVGIFCEAAHDLLQIGKATLAKKIVEYRLR